MEDQRLQAYLDEQFRQAKIATQRDNEIQRRHNWDAKEAARQEKEDQNLAINNSRFDTFVHKIEKQEELRVRQGIQRDKRIERFNKVTKDESARRKRVTEEIDRRSANMTPRDSRAKKAQAHLLELNNAAEILQRHMKTLSEQEVQFRRIEREERGREREFSRHDRWEARHNERVRRAGLAFEKEQKRRERVDSRQELEDERTTRRMNRLEKNFGSMTNLN